jgi:glutamate N-acetyltransferase/amino-acid N-acetyltransferase
MSTNDTVLLLASGVAYDRPLMAADIPAFEAALTEVCTELAKMIPDDGEGASHLITIDVRGCASREDARQIARCIANSSLVKTGIAGADPNWGRFVSAAGYAGVPFRPDQLTLSLNGTVVFRDGAPVPFDPAALSTSIRNNRQTRIDLELQEGSASIRFWTSDLTVDYVRLNSEYTT